MKTPLSVIWIVGFVLFISFNVFAQTTQSPYTALGIGDIIQPNLVSNMGMGVSAVAYPGNKNFNLMNPAMLGIRGFFTSFEVGISGERRSISSDTLDQTNGSGNLSYLALAFPIKQSRISAGFGLVPYSYVNYNIISQNQIDGIEEESSVNFKGEGGLNTVFYSTGFHLFESLALGFKVSYLFGSITEETIFDIDQPQSFSSALYESTKVNDFLLGLGAAYYIKLNDKSQIFLAGIYELGNDLNATRDERLEQRQRFTGLLLSTDTIFSDQKETLRLPRKYGFGVSFINSKWLISTDLIMQDWNEFSDPRREVKNPLVKSFRAGLGAEFIPDATSVSSYFNRMIYRAGISYELSPYNLNNEQIYDFGINFGVSLPVINRNAPSLISLAFQYGQRSGGGGEFAITENYFRLALGFTINDIWFYRRKIE
ncbi:MAG: hypothetical protein KFF73_00925 [Cyclobacteriaceae bacterium]|nr:hypothetical protein [Cyclobacteriaceae bacterium]